MTLAEAALAGEVPLARAEQQLLARWPETKLDPTLDRVALLLTLLGQPQTTYSSVHLTGTNGKTSTARMVEALLARSGTRTGRFTSPHLTSLRERISLDQHPIDTERFLAAYAAVAEPARRVDDVAPYPLSFFEMMVAMAYQAFAAHGVETAVVEVGMGGRWDATNVIDAEVATILPISLDHTDYLGPTATAIATEKAGIIKPGAIAVTARQDPDVDLVVRAHAERVGATVVAEGHDFGITGRTTADAGQVISVRGLAGRYEEVPLGLRGAHQAQNAAVAIATAEALRGGPLEVDVVRAALGQVTSPGRFEIRPGTPPVILDAAHNPHGARALVESLREHGSGRTVAVVAIMADKDYDLLLHELEPAVDEVVCTRNSSPRCLPAIELAGCARQVWGQERVYAEADLATAVAAARDVATRGAAPDTGNGRVLVTGSVATVGDAARLLSTGTTERGT